jgi:hypothetical protein
MGSQMMDVTTVALFNYDTKNSFIQIFRNQPLDVWSIKEIRFSTALWNHLLQSGMHDQTFRDKVSVETDVNKINQGIVGMAYGAPLTTEWVIEHASMMTPLPGMVYLMLYVPHPVQPTPTPQPVNLLNLAQQVTSP